jgi:hypothetical protein
MATYMRPYLELEKQIAEALGWTEVEIHGDLDFGGWSTAWHNQTLLKGVPPGYGGIHRPEFLVPRYIYEGKVLDEIHQDHLEINLEWYTDSVGALDSSERIFETAVEKYSAHPNKKVALYVAVGKMIVLITNHIKSKEKK